MVKRLEECKACEHHEGMSDKFDSFVRCSRSDDCIVYSLAMPSFWNKGIKNGEIIVHCGKST